MTRTNQDIDRICVKLLSHEINTEPLPVSLDEFQRFYSTLVNLTKRSPKVSLVNLEDRVLGQFSDIAPQHFDISEKKALLDTDFDFIKYKTWYGAKTPPEKFAPFLWTEFKQNFPKLSLIAIVSFALLFLADNKSLYELIISLLIQSSTVFLSLYIIFTVSQSQSLYSDMELFKSGVLHKYYRDDKNITLLGILTVSSTFLTAGLLYMLSALHANVSIQVIKALLVTGNIVLLFDTFLTVVNYYLERSRDVIERNIAADILHDDFESNDEHR
jgi:hypothetical protein